jgi:hypothetical protein
MNGHHDAPSSGSHTSGFSFFAAWPASSSAIAGHILAQASSASGATTPSIAFYPDHTFAYINPDGLSGEWYELEKPGTFLLVYRRGFSQGFTVTATLQRRPLRLNYTEWDMMCSFEKVGSFASTK